MTSLAAPILAAAAKPAAMTAPVFGPRIIIGLVGVLLAVLVSSLNALSYTHLTLPKILRV